MHGGELVRMDPAYVVTAALDGEPFEQPCDDTSEACNAADWLESAGARGITVTVPIVRDPQSEPSASSTSGE